MIGTQTRVVLFDLEVGGLSWSVSVEEKVTDVCARISACVDQTGAIMTFKEGIMVDFK